MFYNHPGVANAYFGKISLDAPLEPLASSKPTYFTYHEIWRLTGICSWKQLQTRLNILLTYSPPYKCGDSSFKQQLQA